MCEFDNLATDQLPETLLAEWRGYLIIKYVSSISFIIRDIENGTTKQYLITVFMFTKIGVQLDQIDIPLLVEASGISHLKLCQYGSVELWYLRTNGTWNLDLTSDNENVSVTKCVVVRYCCGLSLRVSCFYNFIRHAVNANSGICDTSIVNDGKCFEKSRSNFCATTNFHFTP